MLQGDASDPAVLAAAFVGGVDRVFALGATLTTDAETRFDHGLAVNLHGMLHLLDACRQQADRAGAVVPRLVYTSSIAAFGGPLPAEVDDEQARTPQTSYGTQKAVNELLINDYSRRGHVDGRALRLPIVVTRPVASAPSVSERVAALIRGPLGGDDVDCPWAPDTVMPLASVQAAADALVKLSQAPAEALGHFRAVNLPACRTTVAELVDTVAGWPADGLPARGQVHWTPDAGLQAIVNAWPQQMVSARAEALGLRADASVADIVRRHLEHPEHPERPERPQRP
jgi:nucleoside-diphosphate-sugar epimerase